MQKPRMSYDEVSEYRVKVVTETDVQLTLKNLGLITTNRLIAEDDLTDEEMLSVSLLFDEWIDSYPYLLNEVIRFGEDLYSCIQAHTSQEAWTPPTVPALWRAVSPPGVIPDWVQPTGAHDAYDIGDTVIHVEKTWISGIDANTTVPGENLAFDWWTEVV